MKKPMTVFLLLIVCVYSSACGHYLKLDTPEKIVAVYHENEEYFNTAEEAICRYVGSIPHVRIRTSEDARDSNIFVEEINGLYFEGPRSLTPSDCRFLYDAISPLMERCHCSAVALTDSKVEFLLEGPIYGRSAELYYYLDTEFVGKNYGQLDDAEYLRIDPHWYAHISHD